MRVWRGTFALGCGVVAVAAVAVQDVVGVGRFVAEVAFVAGYLVCQYVLYRGGVGSW